jgi:hypothetical protein
MKTIFALFLFVGLMFSCLPQVWAQSTPATDEQKKKSAKRLMKLRKRCLNLTGQPNWD